MSTLEIIGVILSILGVVFTAQKKMIAWYINILASLVYGYIFYEANLYADAELQVFFILTAIYGIYKWGVESSASISSSTSCAKSKGLDLYSPVRSSGILIIQILFVSIGAIFLGYFHQYFLPNAFLPYLDAFLTSASIWATILAAHKKRASWIVWILVDTLYVLMYFYKDLYLTAGLYGLFVVLAWRGFYKWKVES